VNKFEQAPQERPVLPIIQSSQNTGLSLKKKENMQQAAPLELAHTLAIDFLQTGRSARVGRQGGAQRFNQ
jgi:hypothetical protein